MPQILKNWFNVKNLFLPFLVVVMANLYYVYLTSSQFFISPEQRIFFLIIINQIYIFMGVFVYMGFQFYDKYNKKIDELEYMLGYALNKKIKSKKENVGTKKKEN